MPPKSEHLFKVGVVRQHGGQLVPSGFVKMPVLSIIGEPNTLSDLRRECQERGYMTDEDTFLYAPPAYSHLMCPITRKDEASLVLHEYLTGSDLAIIRSRHSEKPANDGSTKTDSSAKSANAENDDLQSATSTVTDIQPVIAASYVLACWGGQNVSMNDNNRERVTAYTVTPLPDYFLRNSATFCAFARAADDGERVVFSVESTFQRKSLLYVGTGEKSRKVEFYSLLSGTTHTVPDTYVEKDKWTHLALVWNLASREVLTYVNGQLVKQQATEREDRVDFLCSLKTAHFVLGRSKKDGKWDAGWDGDITDARVYKSALEEPEIRELAMQIPKPLNPSLLGVWNDRKV